jgi:hypothetical protein
MAGTNSSPSRFSQYSLEIECPQCGKKMILDVGLMGDPKNNLVNASAVRTRLFHLCLDLSLVVPSPPRTSLDSSYMNSGIPPSECAPVP